MDAPTLPGTGPEPVPADAGRTSLGPVPPAPSLPRSAPQGPEAGWPGDVRPPDEGEDEAC
jgi:hypothetical protein